MKNNGIAVLLKNPIKGKVKTRLAAAVGDDRALHIYRKLIEYTVNIVRSPKWETHLYFDDHIDRKISRELKCQIQPSGDLGQKLLAISREMDNTYEKFLLIGSDCPELKKEHLHLAFRKLENSEVVIGPAEDGGYYLIGMQRIVPSIFIDMPWSKTSLLSETLKSLTSLNINFQVLEELRDLDTEEDLKKFNFT